MVERLGPIGIVDLADRVGRDYTTVSRQVTKLESSGPVERRASAADGRVREAAITDNGKALTNEIDVARDEMARAIFKDWSELDVVNLVRLMRRFADTVKSEPPKP
jgi:DNA-binding MarR family transcriptional regulator